jgi:predicted Zn-dependent peptidase
MYEHYELPNKANVYLIPQENASSTTTLIMYPVGSRYEPEKLSGVSHYIEHMMFKGTKKRKTSQILTREIDRLGAAYNAFTSKEYTGYYIKTGAEYTELSLDILSDMLFNSVFDAKEMEKEKGPVCEELRMYKDNPIMNIDNIFEEMFYAGCPLGRDIGGSPEHVMSYKRPDVLKFRNRFYGPNNMHIFLSGKIDDKVRAWVDSLYGNKKNKGIPSRTFKPAILGSSNKRSRIFVEHKDVDQVQLMLGFPAFKYGDKNNVALGVMNTILGGSMSSRLFTEIREKRGLAYTVRASAEAYRDAGYSYVRAGVEPKNVNKTIAVVQKELEKMANKGVSKRELVDAKTHLRGAMQLSLEDSSTVANWYAKQALFAKKIMTPDDKLAKVDAVTSEQIQDIAKKVFQWNKVRVAIIGNVETKDVIF